MSEEAWRPVIPTGREDALVEEFPGYLREAVFGWLQGVLGAEKGYVQAQRFVEFQNDAHVDIGFKSGGLLEWRPNVLNRLRSLDDATFTNLLDHRLSVSYFPNSDIHPLERILSNGGSAWTVIRWNRSKARLTARVPAGVRSAVSGVLGASDAASKKLQEAWIDAYGAGPRASAAYSHAVVAVETAALSVISTGHPEPTLGNVISVLESSNPKWRLILRDNDKAPSAKSLAMMLRTLWRGHESRHGRPDYAEATLEEARAAVMLAATLVQWFTSGAVVSAPAK
ncbi:hypothetical protein NYS50_10540 [Curtobacterium flaccumfaciens pv. flaccumfaciens]|uniref:hypothetical protein n=1 Tax=Curtobacterium flaccumfaciens TaxID=2035 RepID=UPI00217D830A|nr:hypothetical protein [Curtobacterium flaccumfaciens]MCS6548318.1 hypothetical protein [Curtobacterium flaccumfaciens pv. flaccumfaciens]